MRSSFFPGLIAIVIPWLLISCSSAEVSSTNPSSRGGTGGTGGNGGGGGSIALNTATSPEPDPTANMAAPPNCGDGVLDNNEACDDGNKVSGDGCSANCLRVEPGYSCVPAGQLCHQIAHCGDGVLVPPEQCDDGNSTAGDGCSPTCKVEIGYKCSSATTNATSVCTHTTCGDSKIEGAEGCDDGNSMPFDGCSSDCQNEPNCSGASCTSRCGDGIVLGEECDDGNNVDGDGCSKDCKIEQGFTCTQPTLGDTMMVPVIYRDFRYHNPADFESGTTGSYAAFQGMVNATLDANGKPVYSGIGGDAHVTSADSFAEWYRDTSGVNHSTASKMTLWNNGQEAYVNRYGPNGEQWPTTITAYFCGNVGNEVNGQPCTFVYGQTDCDKDLALGYKMTKCWANGGNYNATFVTSAVDGNPLFFPVDDDLFTPLTERSFATIPPYYDPTASWPHDVDASGADRLHNFSFTSEVRYWFLYDKTKTYTLDFTGDDDVWVFINRKLAVDLGGVHTPVNGSIVIGANGNGTTTVAQTYPIPAPAATQQSTSLGLQSGQVYEIAVFQAERQTTGSSYKLTLSGFNAAPSDCTPKCGDGIVELGEECDDGVNAGGYGQCGAGCKLVAGYCGDGIVQPGEDCDDGVNNGNPCPSGCRMIF
jgi:fibro-slime domain-containing protein